MTEQVEPTPAESHEALVVKWREQDAKRAALDKRVRMRKPAGVIRMEDYGYYEVVLDGKEVIGRIYKSTNVYEEHEWRTRNEGAVEGVIARGDKEWGNQYDSRNAARDALIWHYIHKGWL